ANDTGYQCGYNDVFRHWTLRNGSEDFSFYLYGTRQFGNVEAWATYGYWTSTGESNTFMPAWASANFYDPTGGVGGTPQPGQEGRVLSMLRYMSPSQIGGVDRALTRSDETNFDFQTGLRGTVFNDRF